MYIFPSVALTMHTPTTLSSKSSFPEARQIRKSSLDNMNIFTIREYLLKEQCKTLGDLTFDKFFKRVKV